MPDTIGRYEILGELGAGVQATAYRGRDPLIGREVAIKLLRSELRNDPQFRARFEREVRAAASLEHRAIVPIYDFGEEERQLFVVMRLMRGGTLAERIAAGQIELEEAAEIVERLASALDHAHRAGIIHRDVKPGNTLLDDAGSAYLTDFGIARLADATTMLTQVGGVLGTPLYMSPEQGRGDELTAASDIYSPGAMAFEIACGRPPFIGQDPVTVLLKHRQEVAPTPQSLNAQIPDASQDALVRAMAKDPLERFTTASDFALEFGRPFRRALALEPGAAAAITGEAPSDDTPTALLDGLPVADLPSEVIGGSPPITETGDADELSELLETDSTLRSPAPRSPGAEAQPMPGAEELASTKFLTSPTGTERSREADGAADGNLSEPGGGGGGGSNFVSRPYLIGVVVAEADGAVLEEAFVRLVDQLRQSPTPTGPLRHAAVDSYIDLLSVWTREWLSRDSVADAEGHRTPALERGVGEEDEELATAERVHLVHLASDRLQSRLDNAIVGPLPPRSRSLTGRA